jgi:DNA-binding beta-propeller fold protein YncE
MRVNLLLLIGVLAGIVFAAVADTSYTPPGFALKWGALGSRPGELNAPEGVTVGPEGQIYVADTNNHRVQVFDASGTYLFEWGSLCDLESGEGCDDPSGAAQFNTPEGIVYSEPAGIVYLADSGNNRIQAFSPDGDFLFAWGSAGSEPGQFINPVGLAVDGDANVYVADVVNHRVQVFDLQGRFLRAWGEKGEGPGELRYPTGIAVFETNVYVTDNGNHRVQRFDLDGAYLDEWGSLCTLATGEGCVDPAGNGQFRRPFGITVDSDGRVFVVDQGNHRVEVFTAEGEFLAKWGGLCALFGTEDLPEGEGCVDPDGAGPLETGDGQFLFPKGIAISPDGTVYIADSDNHRIEAFRSRE